MAVLHSHYTHLVASMWTAPYLFLTWPLSEPTFGWLVALGGTGEGPLFLKLWAAFSLTYASPHHHIILIPSVCMLHSPEASDIRQSDSLVISTTDYSPVIIWKIWDGKTSDWQKEHATQNRHGIWVYIISHKLYSELLFLGCSIALTLWKAFNCIPSLQCDLVLSVGKFHG